MSSANRQQRAIPLVSYSSSSSSSDADTKTSPPPAKRRKSDSSKSPTRGNNTAVSGSPPPLPESFYDLYASSVRTSVVDDASLHDGRRRRIPHRVGNWPSHVYIECAWRTVKYSDSLTSPKKNEIKGLMRDDRVFFYSFFAGHPSPTQHEVLAGLIDSLRAKVDYKLHSLLVSDTSAPQPLHVSLSRPIVLSTDNKTDFLAKISDSISSSGVKP